MSKTEEFLNKLHNKGFTTIVSTGEYINAKTSISLEYECGHIDTVIPSNLITRGNKSSCRVCSPIVRYNQKSDTDILNEVHSKGYVDISSISHVNSVKDKATITYTCGHQADVSTVEALIRNGVKSKCRVCISAQPKSEAWEREALQRVHTLGYTDINSIVSEEKNKVNISYTCGHTATINYTNLLNRGDNSKCRLCNKRSSYNKNDIDTELQLLHKKGFTSIVNIAGYTDIKSRIDIMYSCGHVDSCTASSLLYRDNKSKCIVCYPNTHYKQKTPEQFNSEVRLLYPELAVTGTYINSLERVPVKHSVCGHEWEIIPNHFLSKGIGKNCPKCFPSHTSQGERELAEWLRKYTKVQVNNRSLLKNGLELDIYLPEHKLAIEYNGEYWHSDLYKPKSYHLDKTIAAEQQGIRLVHIFAHEWETKQDIVKSRLLSMLGRCYSLGARKTIVKEIPYPKLFLQENHIQGAANSSINLGLFLEDMMVATMTFSRPRFSSDYDYELVRYCSLTTINIIGGASKLLKYFLKNYNNPSVISYADRRWSQGRLYEQLGFALKSTSTPGYFYMSNSKEIIKRYSAQKHKLKDLFPEYFDDNKSEQEIMQDAGYFRVYDCGNLVYSLNRKCVGGQHCT